MEERIEKLERMVEYLSTRVICQEMQLLNALGVNHLDFIPADSPHGKQVQSKKTGQGKLTNEDRAKLLEGAPYTKEKIEGMTRGQLSFLGAQWNLKTFGLKKEELADAVFKAQPKHEKSSGKNGGSKKIAAKKK